MNKLNENIITLYSKWKEGYVRKENNIKLRVKDFLSNKNKKDADIFKISKDGKYLDASGDVYIYDEDIHDGKLPVPFGDVKGAFYCNNCDNLTSLEGAPKEVGGIFNCSNCRNLTSLDGAPKEVGIFICTLCQSLTSLEGAPKKVEGSFNCYKCPSLASIEDLPKEIGGDLYIDWRFKGKIPDDVTIGGKIKYYG